MSTSFHIASEKFVGPIELLLQKMRQRKMHSSEIALGEIADSFLMHYQSMDSMPVGHAAHFAQVSAALVLHKTRSLLPKKSLVLEKDEQGLDRLLKRVQAFESVQEQVKSSGVSGDILFRYTGIRPQQVVGLGGAPSQIKWEPIPLEDFTAAAHSVLKKNTTHRAQVGRSVVKKKFTPRLAVRLVYEYLQEHVKAHPMSWTQLVDAMVHRSKEANPVDTSIASFLAALDLIRDAGLVGEQESSFGEITFRSN